MTPDLHWIPGPWPGKLAIVARPRGEDWLADEAAALRRAGIDMVVSLLEPDEAARLGLGGEGRELAHSGVRFQSLPIPDRGVPASQSVTTELLQQILAELRSGHAVAVHCRQGIGRSGLIAIGVLLAAGTELNRAIEITSAARGLTVPETQVQLQWLTRLAETGISRPAPHATLPV